MKYDQNLIKWFKGMRKRFKVPLFLLVLALLILDLGLCLNRLISAT